MGRRYGDGCEERNGRMCVAGIDREAGMSAAPSAGPALARLLRRWHGSGSGWT